MLDAVPDGTLPPLTAECQLACKVYRDREGSEPHTLQGLPSSSQHPLLGTYLDKRDRLAGSSGA